MTPLDSQFDLAILGADDPAGVALLRLLEEREVAVGTLYPLTLSDAIEEEDELVSFAGQDWPCLPAAGFDFARAQALVVVSRSSAAKRLLAEIQEKFPTMPVASLETVEPSAAIVVARVLRGLDALAGVMTADAFVTLPVALSGKAGIDELSGQTRGLFNLDRPDPEVFPLQVAFNLMPTPVAGYDAALAQAAARLLDKPVAFSSVLAPMFYGAAVMLHARCERSLALEDLRRAYARADGITLMESDLPAGLPTPATDAADSDDVFIGRIEVDESRACRLWLVFDPLRLEAAQLAAAVENWIDKPTNSMLT